MTDWFDPKYLSMSFGIEANESAVEFFERQIEDLRGFEAAINARMKQLFDENIVIGGEKSDKAYNQLLKIFMLGYGHGWNDRKCVEGLNKNT